MEIWEEPACRSRPKWLPMLCHYRDWSANAVVRFDTGAGYVHYKVVFALQSPQEVHFVKVDVLELSLPSFAPASWQTVGLGIWRRSFMLDFASWTSTGMDTIDKDRAR